MSSEGADHANGEPVWRLSDDRDEGQDDAAVIPVSVAAVREILSWLGGLHRDGLLSDEAYTRQIERALSAVAGFHRERSKD